MPDGLIVRDDFPLYMTPQGIGSLRKTAWEPEDNLLARFRDDYYKVDSTTDPFVLAYGTVGLGLASRKPEATPPMFDEPSMGRPFMLVFPTYALAVSISLEAQEDDKDNVLVPTITRELRIAMEETMEEDAVAQFNDGFDLQGWEPDGVPLFSQYHPILRDTLGYGSPYWSNRHPTDAALSQSALDSVMTDLSSQRNDTGRWLRPMEGMTLEVAPALAPYAYTLLGTARALGNNNNDINIHYKTMSVRVNPRLRDPNAWFVDTGKENHSWVWYNRVKPSFHSEANRIIDVTTLKTRARWGRGASHSRGKWGSRGPA